MKVTLKKDGNSEVRVGAFCPHIVGTWKKGNPYYCATLKNGQRVYGECIEGLRSQLMITI